VRLELIDRNPAAHVDKPAVPAVERTVPTLAELARSIDVARAAGDLRMVTLIRVAALTGARRGELAALRWCDLDLDQALATIDHALTVDAGTLIRKGTKTGSRKTVGLDQVTVDELRTWRARTA